MQNQENVTFSFGENWEDYLNHVSELQIEEAKSDILEWLTKEEIESKKVLDIGSGSGIHSLAFQKLGASENGLNSALGRLFALSENYPDLKANENMMQLSEELTTTENKVAFARQAFNDGVMRYNILRESFPSNFVANFFQFKPAALLEIESEEKREVPKVSF